MNTAVILIVTFIFLAILGGGAFFVFKTIKKTDPKNSDESLNSSSDSVQSFLPFKEINYNLINLGGHQYRAVIECSSTNYNLKTEREKEVIEASFQRFVNSLTHPIWFFIQTKTIDNSKMIAELENELFQVMETNPNLEDYAREYLAEMKNLNAKKGDNKQKKKYIIVPYDEANNLPELTDEEKHEYSVKEALQRAFMLANGLSSAGIKCKVLGNEDLIELIYSCYHKDNYSNAEFLNSGEFSTLIVDGKNPQQEMSNDARVDFILYDAQMRIANEVAGRTQIPEVKKDYEEVIRKLNQLRDDAGAYYKGRR